MPVSACIGLPRRTRSRNHKCTSPAPGKDSSFIGSRQAWPSTKVSLRFPFITGACFETKADGNDLPASCSLKDEFAAVHTQSIFTQVADKASKSLEQGECRL
jgi:hypothetical protein